jgi:hypothetical protein
MVNKLFLPILLLAPAVYASAQQPVLPPAPQLAALSTLLAEVQPAPQAATLPAAQPAPRPDQAALQPATPTQPAPQAAPQPVSNSVQPSRAGSDWQMVEAVTPGTTLYVNAEGGHKVCKLKSAAADMLTCAGSSGLSARGDLDDQGWPSREVSADRGDSRRRGGRLRGVRGSGDEVFDLRATGRTWGRRHRSFRCSRWWAHRFQQVHDLHGPVVQIQVRWDEGVYR